MIDAYLDESGIHENAKVCVIAGYFGGPGQMRRFGNAWVRMLADFNFPMAEFHAKDLMKKRDARPMLEALATVISEQHKVYPVAHAIVIADFYSLSNDERRFITGATLKQPSGRLEGSGCPNRPYFVPFQNIVKLITDYAPVGGKANFNFGLGRPLADYATVLFEQMLGKPETQLAVSTWTSRDRLGKRSFPLAAKTAPLQAADLFVHLVYQHMLEGIGSSNFMKLPTSLEQLCMANAKATEHFGYQDRAALENVIAQAKTITPAWNPR